MLVICNMGYIDKIALIKVKDGKILSTKSVGKTKYYLPGGKREHGESDEQTLVREIFEELNVEIISSSIQYFGTFTAQSDGAREGVLVKMTCYRSEYIGTEKAKNEIEEVKWLTYQDYNQISEVDKKIFDLLHQRGELL